jgi:hypothetical protein
LKKVIKEAKIKENETVIIELIKRLNQSFAGKITIANIIPVCFPSTSNKYHQTLIEYISIPNIDCTRH